jgi:hypothetical protein
LFQQWLKVFYTFNKIRTSYGHDKIDGIETSFAMEASCQVGLPARCGLIFIADRTKKSKKALADFTGNTQLFGNHGLNRYKIAYFIQ